VRKLSPGCVQSWKWTRKTDILDQRPYTRTHLRGPWNRRHIGRFRAEQIGCGFLRAIDVGFVWIEHAGLGHWYPNDILRDILGFLKKQKTWESIITTKSCDIDGKKDYTRDSEHDSKNRLGGGAEGISTKTDLCSGSAMLRHQVGWGGQGRPRTARVSTKSIGASLLGAKDTASWLHPADEESMRTAISASRTCRVLYPLSILGITYQIQHGYNCAEWCNLIS
jgi:hypothetical protein